MGTEEVSFGGEGGSVEPEPTMYPVYILICNYFHFCESFVLATKVTFCVGVNRQPLHPGPAGPGYFSGGQRPHCKFCLSFYKIVNKFIIWCK